MSELEVSPQGLAVNRSFEGRALKAYRDSVHVITVGYGNTNFDKFAVAYLGGPITMSTTITEEQAEYLLVETMKANYTPAVRKAFGVNVNQRQVDAGSSFHYNTGAIARASWVKISKALGDPAAIRSAIVSWNKAGGKVLAGLTRRREREFAILQTGDYGPEGRTKPPVLNASGKIVGVAEETHALNGTPGMLRLDDKSEFVKDYNASLRAIGFTKVPADDVFTLATQDATMSVQKAHPGLVVDGIAGPATRAAIGRDADAKRKLGNVTKIAAGGSAPAGLAEVAGFHIPGAVWIAAAVLVAMAVGWLAYRYKDEIEAITKRT